MYENGVPEKIIGEKSGHRSVKGLRAYEHTSVSQERAAGTSISADTGDIKFNSTDVYGTVKEEGDSRFNAPDVSDNAQLL